MGDAADARGKQLAARCRLQKARRQAERELVGVADAVHAGETVVVEQPPEGERLGRGVKARQVTLPGVGLIAVLQARFQRLQPRAVADPAFEEQAAVGNRQANVALGLHRVGVVGRVAQAGGERQEPPGLRERQPQARFHVQPFAAFAAAPRKRRPRAAERPRERASEAAGVGDLQLRQPPVGFAPRFQALEALPPQTHGQAAARVFNLGAPFQLHAAEGADARAEVGEVVVVAHRGEIDQRASAEEPPAMVDVEQPALGRRKGGFDAAGGKELAARKLAVVVVVGAKPRRGDFRSAASAAAPELAFEARSPARHVARRYRRVEVGGEIEVVGNGEIQALVVADGRKEEAAHAFAAHRKAQVGGVEDRHRAEAQAGVAGGRERLGFVELDGFGAQQPAGI